MPKAQSPLPSSSTPPSQFVLIKRECFDAAGAKVSAKQSAMLLLTKGIWPLWEHTRNRKAISAGHQLAIYLSGDGGGQVVATAVVEKVGPWTRVIEQAYPLALDGIPFNVLHLKDVQILPAPVPVKERIQKLSFLGANRKKWGVAFMGGSRSLSAADFLVLTKP